MVSVALHNILGNISWKTNNEEFTANYNVDSLDIDDPQTPTDTTVTIGAFDTPLPTVFHLGVGYQFLDNLVFTMDMEQTFAERIGYSNQASLAFGTEYKPIGFLPLRSGFCFGGKWGFVYGVGFGLHFGIFEMNFAYSMHRAVWPTLSSGFSTALDMKFTF